MSISDQRRLRLRMTAPVADADFARWSREWLDLAGYRGKRLSGVPARIARIGELWRGSVPGVWERKQYPSRLLKPGVRYCRRNAGEKGKRRGEHVIEYELLCPRSGEQEASCLGFDLVDGVNAVPLSRDVGGGRAANVEADMLLLVDVDDGYRQLLIEVKDKSNHAWYGVVENLRQLKLFTQSRSAQLLFHERNPEMELPSALPVTALTLAPSSFYSAAGRQGESVAPAQELVGRLRAQGADLYLATWDPDTRTVEVLP
jgi:hypothetical protein